MSINKRSFFVLTLFALLSLGILMPKPGHAQNNQTTALGPSSGAQNFGSATCRKRVPCPDSGDYSSASELAAMGNSCMAEGFGAKNENGFFDDVVGLDINNCLTLRSDLIKTRDSKNILPLCCIMPMPDKTCVFHCDMQNNWH